MVALATDNGRIAKNTILLYFRTILIMLVSIYTSRVVLKALGVVDFGVYQAVGGVVAMFSVISGALSNAISRYITFGLGKGDLDELNRVFSTSVNIQLLLSLIIVCFAEIIGVWFLNNKMSIPAERLTAANWVFQFALLSFVLNLVSVPFNASIIAHERMGAFAYISIIDVVLKLSAAIAIQRANTDRLILFMALNVVVAFVVRLLYSIYCRRNFRETKYHFVKDKTVFKEMLGFAGWSFLTNGAYVFNNQGVNILMNVFFGVAYNAARGLANQAEGAIVTFVNNFTTALSPQITKSYAAGDQKRNFYLICKGAKFSCFLLLIFALPFVFETDFVLNIWLDQVPENTALFLRLSFLGAFVTCIGRTGTTACMATGNIKNYTIILTSIGLMSFFSTWLAYHFGAPASSCYYIFALVYVIVEIARLVMMKKMLGFPPMLFVRQVLFYVFRVTAVAIIPPLIVFLYVEPGIIRFVVTVLVCFISSGLSVLLLGMTASERSHVVERVSSIVTRHKL